MTETLAAAPATSPNAEAAPTSAAPSTVLTGTPAPVADANVSATPNADKAAETKVVPETIPESYTLKLPENASITEADFASVTKLAKELGITKNEAAQKLVDHTNGAVAGVLKAREEGHWKQVEKWGADLKADPVFGGANFDANVQLAQDGLKRLDPDGAVTKFLKDNGHGSNPIIVKLFALAGKMTSEDKLVQGGQTGVQKRDPAQVLFGNTKYPS